MSEAAKNLISCTDGHVWERNSAAEKAKHLSLHGDDTRDWGVSIFTGNRDEAPRPSLGKRTVADLKWGPPPQPLIERFFTTDGPLVLYGPGGVGKGTFACWLIQRFLALDIGDVYVLDYESHEEEWGTRLRGLGVSEDDMKRVHYRCPFADDWEPRQARLSDVAEWVRDDAREMGCGLLVVDSIVMASDGDAAMGGAEAAKGYFAALATIGLRSLSLGHVAAASEKWPAKPFGSSYVHNLARETWAMEQVEGEFVPTEPVVFTTSTTFRVELRNRKNSQGPAQDGMSFDITYWQNGELDVQPVVAKHETRDLVRDALRTTPGMSIDQIVKAIKEDTGEAVSAKAVTNALGRNPDWFVKTDTSKRPFRWGTR